MSEIQILQILLGEFYDKLRHIKSKVVDRAIAFPDAPNKIKVAVGMRRVGKTYFLYQNILKLLEKGTNRECILYINFEDDRLLPLDQHKLTKLVEAFYAIYPDNHDRKCYLFLDEIQNIADWPLVIRRLHDTKNIEIFLTGSSAKLLSKEIATNLRGRSLATEIWPFSFEEFLQAKKIEIDRTLFDKKAEDKLKHLFIQYLSQGGFPEVIDFSQDVRQRTLQDYIDILIFRDIIERHQIKKTSVIKYMILSMIHNVSNPFSINKFYNDVKSQGHLIAKDILYDYADHIEDTYLTLLVDICDKSLRKTRTNPKKIYAIDPGLVRALTLDGDGNLGRLFENVIFLDLKRLGCTINYYLTSTRQEVDFLIQTPRGNKKLLQVVWQHDDKKTFDREMSALNAAIDELQIPGDIITLDSYLRTGILLD